MSNSARRQIKFQARKKLCLAALGLTFSLSAFGVSLAQEGDVDNTKIEEIIVTAQKREQSIQDVPISIVSYKGEDLVNLGVFESEQLGQFTPGLEISTPTGEGSQLVVFLRGAGLNDFNSNNAGPIGIYADEVYLSSPAATTFDLFDIERVEVLKGPQGTLYGRNTTGGAIKFISNKPTEDFSGNGRVVFGNFGTTSVEAALSGPLSESVNARVAISKDDSDGYGTNLLDGSDTNGVDTLAYRAFLDADITDNFSLRLNLHGNQVNSPGATSSPLGVTTDGSTPCTPPQVRSGICVTSFGYLAPDDVFDGNYNDIQDTDLDASGAYLQADWNLDKFSLTSITAFDTVDRFLQEETDGAPQSLLSINFGVDSDTLSQELRASGSRANGDWLLGLYYLTEELNQDQTIDLFRELRPLIGGGSDPTGALTGAPILFARGLNKQEIDTFALFGQTDFKLTDKLALTVGGRYTDEQRSFDATGQLEDTQTFGPNPLVIYQALGLETDSSEISWRLALDYQYDENKLIYGSVSRGFKSGGFNGGFLSLDAAESSVQLQPYDPEFLTAYEVGFKSEFWDKRLRFNSALFYNDFEDLQVFTQVITGMTPLLVLDNASNAEVLGLEFDVSLVPADGWLVSLNGSFMGSELKDFVTSNGADRSGDEVGNTPNKAFTGLLRYEHELNNFGLLSLQGAVSHRGDIASSNEPFVGGNEYTLTNLRAGLEGKSGLWSVAAYVNNATDQEYLVGSSNLSQFGFIQRFYGQPRTYGIEASFKF